MPHSLQRGPDDPGRDPRTRRGARVPEVLVRWSSFKLLKMSLQRQSVQEHVPAVNFCASTEKEGLLNNLVQGTVQPSQAR